jgi:hypothetical protein
MSEKTSESSEIQNIIASLPSLKAQGVQVLDPDGFLLCTNMSHVWNLPFTYDPPLSRECNLYLVSKGVRLAYLAPCCPAWINEGVGCMIWPCYSKLFKQRVIWDCLYYNLQSKRMQQIMEIMKMPGSSRNRALLALALGYFCPVNNPGPLTHGVQWWVQSKSIKANLTAEKIEDCITTKQLEPKRLLFEQALKAKWPDIVVSFIFV